MGESTTINYTLESVLGDDVFLHTHDSCHKAREDSSLDISSDDSFTSSNKIDNGSGRIYTKDGNQVGDHTATLSVDVGNSGSVST